MPDTKKDELIRSRAPAGGPDIVRPRSEVEALADLGQEAVSPVGLGARAGDTVEGARREAFDTVADGALTFAEGIVDALSMGFIHETGDAANIRRDVHSGKAFVGELTGTAIGMLLPTGPVAATAKWGRQGGQAIAKAVVGEVKAGAQAGRAALIGTRAAETAGEAAVMAGALSVGHQTTDALLDDKEFSAAAALHEAGLAGVLGGTVGFLSGVFSRAASRYDIKSQGGLLDLASQESLGLSDHVAAVRSKWDEALGVHEQRLGVLKHLESEGLLDTSVPEFMAAREQAFTAARAAQRRLAALDFEKAMSGDERAWSAWQKALENYEGALGKLDELMQARTLERVAPKAPLVDPGPPVTENLGLDMNEVARMDALMRDPARAAEYEALYGRPYAPQAQYADEGQQVARTGTEFGGRPAAPSSGTPMERPGKAAPAGFDVQRLPLQAPNAGLASEEAAALGRAPLPGRMDLRGYTPEGLPVAEFPPRGNRYLPSRQGYYEVTGRPVPTEGAVPGRPVMPSEGRYTVVGPPGSEVLPPRSPAEAASRALAALDEPYVPPSLPAPGARFNPAEWTPATIIGEGAAAGRVIKPTRMAQQLDNVLSQSHPDLAKDQLLLPNGYFARSGMIQDMRQNAEAFARFHERMAPTPMETIRAAATPDAPGAAFQPTPVIPRPGVPMDATPTPVIPRGAPADALAPSSPSPVGPVLSPVDNLPGAPRAPGERIPTPVEKTDVVPMDGTTQLTGRERLRRRIQADNENASKAAVRRYLDKWYAESEAMGPRHSPGDRAAEEIRRRVNEMRGVAGGREVAAASTDLGTFLKLPKARTTLGAELQNLYTMRRLADVAAKASKNPTLRRGMPDRVIAWISRRTGGQLGASLLGGMVGAKVGGPLGWFVGAALTHKYIGEVGRIAGAAGRLYQRSVQAADQLLRGRRATFVARALQGDMIPAYSDRGPLKDPVERIEDLRRVASSPATMADTIVAAAGDMNLLSPEFVAAAVAVATAQLTFLAEKAPALRYDPLGRPMPPSAGALRRFLEAEAAVFDLDGLLNSVAKGHVTPIQVEALQRAHTGVYTRLATYLVKDPDVLAKLERSKLRTIEMIVGVPLTPAKADPAFTARQQMGWQPQPQPGMPQPGAGAPQALKIPGTGGPPSDHPTSTATPAQSYGQTGRAPGN